MGFTSGSWTLAPSSTTLLTTRLHAWSNWIRQDLSSHPYKWLRPDVVPLAPYLVCMVQPALIDAHCRKAWMPYFRREGHPLVTPQAFLDSVGEHLLHEAFLEMPILTGEELHDVAMAKKVHSWT